MTAPRRRNVRRNLPGPEDPNWFLKWGDFFALAEGRRGLLAFRSLADALAAWRDGWRDLFGLRWPEAVEAVEAALVPVEDPPPDA